MEYALFSDKQGSGYICRTYQEMEEAVRKLPFETNRKKVFPGELTDLHGFFSRPLKYIGLKDENEAIFLIGLLNSLFPEMDRWLFQSVWIIDSKRIFLMYQPNSGRDYNFINGKWK